VDTIRNLHIELEQLADSPHRARQVLHGDHPIDSIDRTAQLRP
jgi:hypothetical protein